MNSFAKLLALSLSIIFLLSSKPIGNDVNPKNIAYNNNKFAFDLYRDIIKSQKGNVFFSPYSISTALALTYAGTDHKTASEIAKAFYFQDNTDAFHYSYGAYSNTLMKNANGNIQLKIANRIWGEQSFKILPHYLQLTKKAYHSPLEKMSFKSSPENCRLSINSWVEKQTENRIQDLLPQGSITSDTRMVLTNAIYFKGDWLYQFDKHKTKKRKFNLNKTNNIKTEFMYNKGGMDYYANSKYQMLRLPYKGNKQSMILVLPKEADSLLSIEKNIKTSNFNYLFYNNKPEVELFLPKFKMTLPLNLNNHLKNLGIHQAFNYGADFSRLNADGGLYISNVVHKAFIEIDEEGTEAAAATAVVITIESTAAPRKIKPIVFDANHPFLFYIIDNQTKAILFMGRLMNPSS